MTEASNDDTILLMELRSISERSAAASRFSSSSSTNNVMTDDTTDSLASEELLLSDPTHHAVVAIDDPIDLLDPNQHGNETILHQTETTSYYRSNAKRFLVQHPEKSNFNQYWYSTTTIETLSRAILEVLRKGNCHQGTSVAFLSTPSLYFALSPQERINCKLFDVSAYQYLGAVY
mmetsp:Transcript_15339/g.28892  ORF Transcript_15339/g.28892 Transcript_15339/m.28892 type:complete len:176 (-) Transcript_15339:886-1413(-)